MRTWKRVELNYVSLHLFDPITHTGLLPTSLCSRFWVSMEDRTMWAKVYWTSCHALERCVSTTLLGFFHWKRKHKHEEFTFISTQVIGERWTKSVQEFLLVERIVNTKHTVGHSAQITQRQNRKFHVFPLVSWDPFRYDLIQKRNAYSRSGCYDMCWRLCGKSRALFYPHSRLQSTESSPTPCIHEAVLTVFQWLRPSWNTSPHHDNSGNGEGGA